MGQISLNNPQLAKNPPKNMLTDILHSTHSEVKLMYLGVFFLLPVFGCAGTLAVGAAAGIAGITAGAKAVHELTKDKEETED